MLEKHLNGWNPNIVWKLSGEATKEGQEVAFLDVNLQINGHTDSIDYRLFTKPQNLFLYLPRDSNHPQHIFTGLLKSTRHRLLRRCKCTRQAEKELIAHAHQLHKRGYQWQELKKYLLHSTIAKRTPQDTSDKPKVKFRYTYTSGLNKKVLKSILKRSLRPVADISFIEKLKPSFFMANYSYTWNMN